MAYFVHINFLEGCHLLSITIWINVSCQHQASSLYLRVGNHSQILIKFKTIKNSLHWLISYSGRNSVHIFAFAKQWTGSQERLAWVEGLSSKGKGDFHQSTILPPAFVSLEKYPPGGWRASRARFSAILGARNWLMMKISNLLLE